MFPPLFSFLKVSSGLEEDRAALALPWGRAQRGEQGRALPSLSPSSTLPSSQQIWETFPEEVRKFLQETEMEVFRNFASVRCTSFLFLSFSFLNGICCLNISVLFFSSSILLFLEGSNFAQEIHSNRK